MFTELMIRGAVQRPGVGRSRHRPQRVCGDQGYRSRQSRAGLRRRGIRCTIPRQQHAQHQSLCDRAGYRTRHRVERAIHRLQPCRWIATRYEKKAETCLALRHIGAMLLWLEFANTP